MRCRFHFIDTAKRLILPMYSFLALVVSLLFIHFIFSLSLPLLNSNALAYTHTSYIYSTKIIYTYCRSVTLPLYVYIFPSAVRLVSYFIVGLRLRLHFKPNHKRFFSLPSYSIQLDFVECVRTF